MHWQCTKDLSQTHTWRNLVAEDSSKLYPSSRSHLANHLKHGTVPPYLHYVLNQQRLRKFNLDAEIHSASSIKPVQQVINCRENAFFHYTDKLFRVLEKVREVIWQYIWSWKHFQKSKQGPFFVSGSRWCSAVSDNVL